MSSYILAQIQTADARLSSGAYNPGSVLELEFTDGLTAFGAVDDLSPFGQTPRSLSPGNEQEHAFFAVLKRSPHVAAADPLTLVAHGTASTAAWLLGSSSDDSLQLVGGGSLQAFGLAGDDLLDGRDTAAASLAGGDGDDRLLGGGGADTLDGGAGDNTLDGGSGVDMVVVSVRRGDIRVDLQAVGVNLVTRTASDHLVSVETVRALGQGDVRLLGDPVDNDLQADGARVRLDGREGDDVLAGSGDHNNLDGGAGDDRLGVSGAVTSRLYGGAGEDRLTVDTSAGGAAVLDGGEGDDLLTCFGGGATLAGGAGADRFKFDYYPTLGSVTDHIRGLDADDRIDLGSIKSGDPADERHFHWVNQFTGHGGEAVLTWDAAANRSVLELDVTGDGAPELTLRIDGHATTDQFVL